MNKVEIEAKVAQDLGISQDEVCRVFSSILSSVQECFERGENIRLTNFGSFQVADRPERKGRNPASGEVMTIPARRKVSFKPAKETRAILSLAK